MRILAEIFQNKDPIIIFYSLLRLITIANKKTYNLCLYVVYKC